jgi:hypothetical protein
MEELAGLLAVDRADVREAGAEAVASMSGDAEGVTKLVETAGAARSGERGQPLPSCGAYTAFANGLGRSTTNLSSMKSVDGDEVESWAGNGVIHGIDSGLRCKRVRVP